MSSQSFLTHMAWVLSSFEIFVRAWLNPDLPLSFAVSISTAFGGQSIAEHKATAAGGFQGIRIYLELGLNNLLYPGVRSPQKPPCRATATQSVKSLLISPK